MQKDAPYADMPITMSIRSTVGIRYRTWQCIECGQPFLERDGDLFFRIGNPDQPTEAHAGADGVITSVCGRCRQKYTVTIAVEVSSGRTGLPLYMQPQSIFVSSVPNKKLRDVHCYECGKAFFSLSDRITMLVDTVAPNELIDTARMGPMEARCKFNHCQQRWYVRV